MLTLHYVVPLSGTRRVGGQWVIDKVSFPPLADGAAPPDETLVNACHGAMRDQAGRKVPADTLRTYDLREGLAAAFRAVDTKPTAASAIEKETAS